MKIRTIYTCDYCHTDYESETDCQTCEQTHAQAVGISYEYVAGEQHPIGVTILFGETPIKYQIER